MSETSPPVDETFEPPARRYSDVQLARLLEISSAVECECPNHVSQIVSALVEFEEYSKKCFNKDDDDRRIHAMLWRETSRARVLMEEALAELNEFEGIEV